MPDTIKVPIWFWIVAILFTLWNLYGLYDYYNSVTVNETYLMALGDDLGPAFITWLGDMPLWAKAAWGIAILTSVLGAIGLLLRKAWAVTLFIVSFVAMIISFGYQLLDPTMPEMPGALKFMPLVVVLVAVLEIWFAKRMKTRGILR